MKSNSLESTAEVSFFLKVSIFWAFERAAGEITNITCNEGDPWVESIEYRAIDG